MRLEQALTTTADVTFEQFHDLRRHIDPEWIHQALEDTGTTSQRERRLPALHVIWLVIGMALFRSRAIAELACKLNLVRKGRSASITPSAVAQARKRLGEEPMEWLFVRCADVWGHDSAKAHPWRGLALYGVDGSCLRVADTPENRRYFGGPKGHRGQSGYPLLRLVGLMALRSHQLVSAAFGSYATSELSLAAQLWDAVPDESLSIVDRGFLAAGVLIGLVRGGKNRHFLVRAKKNLRFTVIERFSRRDAWVQMKVSSQARSQDPTLPKTWQARAIRYQRKGFRPQMLLTSLKDPKTYPASEVAKLYHERWELELGFDEIKTEVLDRRETIRSKSVGAVHQELWGILLAYNLVRLEMEHVAQAVGVEPTRISFVAVLRLVCDAWLCLALMGVQVPSQRLRELWTDPKLLILPPRRSKRRYDRVVKVKMSSYPRKRCSPTKKRLK